MSTADIESHPLIIQLRSQVKSISKLSKPHRHLYFIVISACLALVLSRYRSHDVLLIVSPPIVLMAIDMLSYIVFAPICNRMKVTVPAIADLCDVRALPALLDALQLEVALSDPIIVAAVSHLLSLQRYDEIPHLGAKNRETLRAYFLDPKVKNYPRQDFKRRTEADLKEYIGLYKANAIILLNAYAHMGVEADLPVIKALAGGGHPLGSDGEIRNAATRAVTGIETRLKQAGTAATLLRAADGYGAQQDQLLRPGAPSTNSETAVLLRSLEE